MRIPATNLFLILLSVFLASLLWFWVGSEERSEIVINVPLEYRNLPKGFEIYTGDEPLRSVNVWIRGSAAIIKNLRPQEISTWVDLQNVRAGEKNFELSPANVQVPYGFSVLRVSPSRIHLRVEQVVTRLVPVRARLEGQPPEGYSVTETTVVPPKVEVTGPLSAINSLRDVTTDSIDISAMKGQHVEKVNLGVESPAARLGQVKEVTVTLNISEISDMITLRHIPVVVTGTKRTVRLTPRSVVVDLQAPKRLLTQISENQIHAELELTGFKPGVYDVTPRIVVAKELEKEVSVKGVLPERIHVRIQ